MPPHHRRSWRKKKGGFLAGFRWILREHEEEGKGEEDLADEEEKGKKEKY